MVDTSSPAPADQDTPDALAQPITWSLDVARTRDPASPRQLICTRGLHPARDGSILANSCDCGGYAAEQCCNLTPCRLHKCGKRGCNCPPADKSGAKAGETSEAAGNAAA